MCEICHGRGVQYNYNHSTTFVNPCPNVECRLAAQERSKKQIKRLKAGLAMQKKVTAWKVSELDNKTKHVINQ